MEGDKDAAAAISVDSACAKRRQYVRGFLAIAMVLCFIAAIARVMAFELPDGDTRDILLMLLGAMIVLTKDVYGWFFGSSQGSENKTKLIANLSQE